MPELWRIVRPHRTLLAIGFVAMAIESAVTIWEPWPLKLIVDNVLGAKPLPPALASWAVFGTSPLALLNAAVAALLVITAVGALASFVQKYLCTAVGQHITQDLRQTLYRHVQRLSLPFFETRRTGDMIVRLTSDVDAAQDFLSSGLLSIAMDLFTLGGMLAVMLYLDWRFTLLALAVAPLLFLVVHRRTHRIKEAAREVKARESGLASIIQESLASIRIVRAFAREPYEEARLEREGHAAMQATLRARSIKAALPPMVDLIVAAGTAVVMLVLGGTRQRYGAFVGATVYVVVQDYAAQLNPFHWMLLVGGLLMFTVLFLEEGLTSLPRALRRWSRGLYRPAGGASGSGGAR